MVLTGAIDKVVAMVDRATINNREEWEEETGNNSNNNHNINNNTDRSLNLFTEITEMEGDVTINITNSEAVGDIKTTVTLDTEEAGIDINTNTNTISTNIIDKTVSNKEEECQTITTTNPTEDEVMTGLKTNLLLKSPRPSTFHSLGGEVIHVVIF